MEKFNKFWSMKNFLARSKPLRVIFFPILRYLDFDLTITHHFTGRKFKLRSWLHKGYWFYGPDRERIEIKVLSSNLRKDDVVIEIGAHIGYISQIIEDLIGEVGSLHVIEPTPESYDKLKQNISVDTLSYELAINGYDGEAPFFKERNGGFTNSLSEKFVNDVRASKVEKQLPLTESTVRCLTLDSFCQKFLVTPSVLKIDVEGAELLILKHGLQCLKSVRFMMIECGNDYVEINQFLMSQGFRQLQTDIDHRSILQKNSVVNLFYVKDI